jgi:HSP20 family protein
MNSAVYRNTKPSLFNMFFDDHATRSHHGSPRRSNHGGACASPATNIFETKSDYKLEVAAPGLDKKDFNLEIGDGTLKVSSTIEKTKNAEDVTYKRREFAKCSFSRSFQIPDDVNDEKIEANYAQGVLTISLPKSEEAKIEKIRQIKVG